MRVNRQASKIATEARFALTALALLASFVPGAEAAVAEPGALMDMEIEDLGRIRVATVTGASKFEQRTTDAPASVTVITREEIRQYGYRTFTDILRSVPGFYSSYDRTYTYAASRGFSRPSDYNSEMLLLLDGNRMNDNIYDMPDMNGAFPVDVDLIERVEVIRGPGSALYGSNAVMAVVNVVTRTAGEIKGTELSAAAGSYQSYKGRATYGSRFENGLGMVLSATGFNSKGQDLYFPDFDPALPGHDPRAANGGVAVDADRERYGSLFFSLSYRDLALESVYGSRKKYVPTAPYGTVFNDNRQYSEDRLLHTELRYHHAASSRTDILARFSYNEASLHALYPYDYATPPDPPNIVINEDKNKGVWWSGELQLTHQLSEGHKVIAGAEYRLNVRQDQKNYDPDIVYLDDHRSSDVGALYAQDELRLGKTLVMNIGVRYDHYDTFGGTINPRFALIHRRENDGALKLLYGTAFRAPNVSELYYQDNYQFKANPGLQPERMTSTEVIYEQGAGQHLRFLISGFYYDIRDLITQEIDPADGMLVYQNNGEAVGKGIEAELDGKWSGGYSGRLSYTYAVVEDKTTGQRRPNSPRQVVKLNLTTPLPEKHLSLGIEEQYTSGQTTERGNAAPGYAVTNVTLLGRDVAPGLDVSASVYNLFDKRYVNPVSPAATDIMDQVPQDGRNYRLQVTYRF